MFTRLIRYHGVSLLVVAALGLLGLVQYRSHLRAIGALSTALSGANRLTQAYRDANGDLRVQGRQLTQWLHQAETVTTAREGALKGALASLALTRSANDVLKGEMSQPTATSVGGVTSSITITDTVRVNHDQTFQDDWLSGAFSGGALSYQFAADYRYAQVTQVLPSGATRVVETAYLESRRSPGRTLPLPVTSVFTVLKPKTRSIQFNPTVYLGVTTPTVDPILGMGLVTYGRTALGEDVIASAPIIGVTVTRHPELVVSPLSVNVGHWLAILDDLSVSPVVVVPFARANNPHAWGFRCVVSTSL